MGAAAVKTAEKQRARIPVVGELRIATSEHCSRCGSRRKTLTAGLGWACTTCFDRCKELAERQIMEQNRVYHLREAYELAIRSYLTLGLTLSHFPFSAHLMA